jgi:hypothetical protein
MSAWVSQQIVGGNSCGACAASYALNDLGKKGAPDKGDITALWNKVQFGADVGPVKKDYSDPAKLADQLGNDLKVELCLTAGSSLESLVPFLKGKTKVGSTDGMQKLKDGGKRAIGIFATPKGEFHYMLTKYHGSKTMIVDSNDPKPDYVEIIPGLLTMKATFAHKWSDGTTHQYTYLGGCIVVWCE